MVDERPPASPLERIRTPATWVGETIFVLAVLVLGLILVGWLVGLNPLSAPVVILALIVIAVIIAGRMRWYMRHREEFLRSNAAHATRERRGY